MTSKFLSKRCNMFYKIYLFFVDEEYFNDVMNRLSKLELKIRKKLRYKKLNLFFFSEQIEADEL